MTDLENERRAGGEHQDLDVLVVGAGFNGVWQLKSLRDLGYKVLLVDNGADYGGTWYWNRYPGIRVDSAAPQYQFSDPELLKEWQHSQRFPGGPEIQKYIGWVADKWDLRKHTQFDTFIHSAAWDEQSATWSATARNGQTFRTKFLVLCTGCLIDKYVPDWKGVDRYKGIFFHPSAWPREKLELEGKRIAVIGTGATAVQIIQELNKIPVGQLTVFQRTPNHALPMRQINYDDENKPDSLEDVKKSLSARTQSFGAFDFSFLPRSCFDDTPEQRQQTLESLWQEGSFKFWLGSYNDTLFDPAANRESYNFWRDKTRARIQDPSVADLLAPMEPAYSFGTKRIPLEQGYFEVFNSPRVKLVDVNATPIKSFTERGIRTSAEELDFDIVIAATGYDALTGTLTRMDIRGRDGIVLRDYWADGVKTHLGLASHGFPNMFFQYGPQAPTTFCNGPACAEMQGKWVTDTLNYCRDSDVQAIEATEAAERAWKEKVLIAVKPSLLWGTKSWYTGDNIPGKLREPLAYLGGVPAYYEELNAVRDGGYDGFVLKGRDKHSISRADRGGADGVAALLLDQAFPGKLSRVDAPLHSEGVRVGF